MPNSCYVIIALRQLFMIKVLHLLWHFWDRHGKARHHHLIGEEIRIDTKLWVLIFYCRLSACEDTYSGDHKINSKVSWTASRVLRDHQFSARKLLSKGRNIVLSGSLKSNLHKKSRFHPTVPCWMTSTTDKIEDNRQGFCTQKKICIMLWKTHLPIKNSNTWKKKSTSQTCSAIKSPE